MRISGAVRSRKPDCWAATVNVAPPRSGPPTFATALARIVPRTAEPLASARAVSATEGIGLLSFGTFESEYPSKPPVIAYVQRSLGVTTNDDPIEYNCSCCGRLSA